MTFMNTSQRITYIRINMALRYQGKEMKSHLDKMLAKYRRGESIGSTAEARLKARGLIERKSGDKKKGKLGKS
jgi:hypothetical protein